MSNLLTKNRLLLILSILLASKFILLPLFAWQDQNMMLLNGKYRQYQKLKFIVDKGELYESQLAEIKRTRLGVKDSFYVDSGSLRLTIQKDIEKIFETSELTGAGFNWILDTPGDIRTLRAQVLFDGTQEHMIKALWGIARSEKIMRQISWRQQMQSFKSNELGAAKGRITLQFYAARPGYWGDMALNGGAGAKAKKNNE